MSPGSNEVPPGYELVRELGRGGLGVVVLARHVGLDRLCAVKRLHAGPTAEATARFRREARVLAALDHPCIVRLHDLIDDGRQLFLVMEYVPGIDLGRRLVSDPPAATEAVRVVRDIADALAGAAACGVVHRDVKPGNVLVPGDGRAKLGDFGVARLQGDRGAFRTTVGTVVGTVAYASPEQLLGDARLSAAADVYALALVAYELTVGRPPFPHGSVDQLVDDQLHRTPPRPGDVLHGYPAAAAEAILAALAKDPAARPNALELAEHLEAVGPEEWPPARRVAPRASGQERAGLAGTEAAPQAAPKVSPTGPSSAMVQGADRPTARQDPDAAPPPEAWIDPPVFRPARLRRTRPRWFAAGAAVALAALVGGWSWIRATGPAERRLRVGSVAVTQTAGPSHAGCPGATFLFRASISTNGRAGTVRVRWTGPDGRPRPPVSVTSRAGQDRVVVALRVVVSGAARLDGRPVLALLAPSSSSSRGPEVAYDCA